MQWLRRVTKSTVSRVKYWEIIADNLSKAGWSWGCVSALDREGRTIWIADELRNDPRFDKIIAEAAKPIKLD